MKITGIEIIPLTMIFKGIIKESFGTVGLREDDVVIRLHTDGGITGLGEGSTLGPFYCAESQETVIGIIGHHLFPKVLESKDPFDVDQIHYQMDKVVFGNTVAKAIIDPLPNLSVIKDLAIDRNKVINNIVELAPSLLELRSMEP